MKKDKERVMSWYGAGKPISSLEELERWITNLKTVPDTHGYMGMSFGKIDEIIKELKPSAERHCISPLENAAKNALIEKLDKYLHKNQYDKSDCKKVWLELKPHIIG